MNAKELILKKINADTNWVDMYTVSFMLGDTLDNVGKLMLDSDITELINNYSSSIFGTDRNTDKIRYIKEAINAERSKENADEVKIFKYTMLLEKAIAADEVRILGKILKINQGLPTNTTDLYSYIKSIEKYIESRYNKDLLESVDISLSKLFTAIKNNVNPKEISQLSSVYKTAKNLMNDNWVKFDLIKFILDPEYKQNQIVNYENYKINFNILEVISEVPHFREMFNVLALNKQILNSLSTRNRLEDIVLNQTIHKSKKADGTRSDKSNISKVLDKAEIKTIKDLIDDHLIKSWIISKKISINIPENAYNNPAAEVLRLENEDKINKFIKYVEEYAIPKLKEKLPNNKFIQLLTFGLKKNIPFYKLPFNMVQVDNTQKTKSLYEEALYAFNNLKTINIEGIDINLVDLFYLYNLIINKDKFGPNSLTRIFEDLISAEGNEDLLVYDFNKWIDSQDIQELINTLPLDINISEESTPVIEDTTIGFEFTPTEVDLEESAVEGGTYLNEQEFAENWSKKEGWSIAYFNSNVKPRLNEAWQMEYTLSEDQESPVQLEGNMSFEYNDNKRPGILAETTIDAIRLGERTATTRYESDQHIDYWNQARIGDRIKFKSGNKVVIVEVTKPLTKLLISTKPEEHSIDYYDTKPSTESKLIALVKATNMKGLHLVYDADLVEEDPSIRNAKGFVRNGEIYINADRATDDTVIHEFGHLYLADAKLNNPDAYYKLLAKIRETSTWRAMRALPEYANKRGSDFDEEVLASMISDAESYGGSSEYGLVLEAIDLVSQDYKDFLKSDILPTLSDTFINNYKEQQELATIKNKLVKDNIIKEDCK